MLIRAKDSKNEQPVWSWDKKKSEWRWLFWTTAGQLVPTDVLARSSGVQDLRHNRGLHHLIKTTLVTRKNENKCKSILVTLIQTKILVLHGSWLKATYYLMMELYLLLASPCQLWRKGELSTSKQLWFLILRHHNLQSLLFDLLVGLLVDLPVDLLVGLPLLVPPPRWGASCRLWHQSTLCRSDKRTRFANPQIQRAHSNRANWKTNHYSKLLLWISWWGKYAKKLNMPINVGHMHSGLGNACRDYWFAQLTLQFDQKS